MHDGQCFYDDDKQGVMYQLGNIMNKNQDSQSEICGSFCVYRTKADKKFYKCKCNICRK